MQSFRIDGGGGVALTPSFLFILLWICDPPTPNPLVPAVLLTLPVHFSQFEPCHYIYYVLLCNSFLHLIFDFFAHHFYPISLHLTS